MKSSTVTAYTPVLHWGRTAPCTCSIPETCSAGQRGLRLYHCRQRTQHHSGRERGRAALHQKTVLLYNEDYPADLTCHVRDPKVWKDGDSFAMVLGARRKDDVGEVLVYRSDDLKVWTLANRITSQKPFGYMWECPDCLNCRGPASCPFLRRAWRQRTGNIRTSTKAATAGWRVTCTGNTPCLHLRSTTTGSTSTLRRPTQTGRDGGS